jgi:glycosyltransferase involved in cell wall biosynthesis
VTVAPVAVQLSFRLGGTDGVAIEAGKWEWALRELGFAVRRVAGDIDDEPRPDDVTLPFLAIEPRPGTGAADPRAVAEAVDGAELVVVENLCSLPLNSDASVAAAQALTGHDGPVVFRHHDLPWQRPVLPAPDGIPPRRADSLHVTINDHSRVELEQRGIEAVTIRNAFELDPAPGDREGTRRLHGFAPDDVVLFQPTRAIPRKNVPGAVAFANRLVHLDRDGRYRYWVTGPAEDGYEDGFTRALAAAELPVTVGRAPTAADGYAAADLVLFPSTWEGFGNPVVESIAHRRPIVVGHYPVLDELTGFGVELLSIDEPELVLDRLRTPRPDILEHNVDRLRGECSLADLPARLERAFADRGWTRW